MLDQGWTLEDRRRYFRWWNRPRDPGAHPPELFEWFADVDRPAVDGASFDRYLSQLRRDAMRTLDARERDTLQPLLAVAVQKARLVPTRQRPWVREWTMDDVLPRLDDASQGRDFERGRRAFADAQCMSCHQMGNDGGSLGPELNSAGSKYDRRSLLESILAPSKVLNEQYLNKTVVRQDGAEVTGRILSESAREIVVDTDPFGGSPETIKREQVREIVNSAVSPMPEGLANVLTLDEILDLVAYLQAGGQSTAPVFQKRSANAP
jgi:putative heme-binding domain-containing protein